MNAVLERTRLLIRPMHQADVGSVMVSEEAAYSHPWSEGIFFDCLKVGYYCVVGELVDRVMAHAVMSVAVGEAHVLNLCVHPHWQGEGHGGRLLEHLLTVAEARGATHMFLEVRATNDVAQKLYRSFGFNEIAQRPGYYPADKGREMAIVFAKTLKTQALAE